MNILRQGNGAAKVQHGAHLFGKCGDCQCEVEALPNEVIYRPSKGHVVQCPHCGELVTVKLLSEMGPKVAAHYERRIFGRLAAGR